MVPSRSYPFTNSKNVHHFSAEVTEICIPSRTSLVPKGNWKFPEKLEFVHDTSKFK